jgi:hypothetical protein
LFLIELLGVSQQGEFKNFFGKFHVQRIYKKTSEVVSFPGLVLSVFRRFSVYEKFKNTIQNMSREKNRVAFGAPGIKKAARRTYVHMALPPPPPLFF